MPEEWQKWAKSPGRRYMDVMARCYEIMANVWKKTNEKQKGENSNSKLNK